MIDPNVNARFARKVNEKLSERQLNVHWLMTRLEENSNRIYPACRGETNISLELAVRIARELSLSLDEVFGILPAVPPRKSAKPGKRLCNNLEKSA